MSEKIQFIIEMPIPKYLQGNPYDEIEGEFRRHFLSATQFGLMSKVEAYISESEYAQERLKETEKNNEWIVNHLHYLEKQLLMTKHWLEVSNKTKVLCSR